MRRRNRTRFVERTTGSERDVRRQLPSPDFQIDGLGFAVPDLDVAKRIHALIG